MKNILTNAILVLLLSPLFVFGQTDDRDRPHSYWSVHAKYGAPLFDTKVEPRYSSFETTLTTRPGLHAIIGGGFSYFLTKKLSLDLDLSYEYGNFLRREEYNYTRFNGEYRSGIVKERFETHSILTPFKITHHNKRVNLSIGMVNAIHLASKVHINHSFFVENQFSSESTLRYSHGDRLVFGGGSFTDRMNIDLERRINFQALAGMDIRLHNRMYLNFEVRQYLRKNLLIREYFQYDVSNPTYRYYNSFTRTFSVGLRYDLKPSQKAPI